MKTAKIVIKDEVNCKVEGLDLDCRKALMRKFEYEVPGARYLPSVRLGRWNGKVSYCSLAGSTYINLIPDIVSVLEQYDYDIELEDLRTYSNNFNFNEIQTDSFSNKSWPIGHVEAGKPIILRDYQVEIVNNFLKNTQCIQEVATGAGKCLSGNTVLSLEIDENTPFGKFMINKLRQEQETDVTKNNKKL